MNYPLEVRSAGPEAMRTYERALPHGERWAVMCALQVAPGTLGSDRAFMEGRQGNQQLDTLPKRQAGYMVAEARRAGISISGKHYCAGIADKRGWCDPEAWVSSNDDVRRVAVKRRLHVEGNVKYDPPPVPVKRTVLAESIIQDEIRKARRTNPKAKVGELRERIIEQQAYKVKGRL